ncbi:MAG TPA: methyltransferase domain-containing protein [Verrucomicrobiae bacterium]|nr:methyltransferase domain-containing protein [Verrucomicrobiae bacterium]
MSKQIDKVLAYYKSTNFDYEHFWSGRKALALHFGYYDSPQTPHEESLQKMNQKVAELAHVTGTDKVLDAGCGYGGSALWLAENCGCEVTGVTVVPYQVQKAQRAAASSPAANKLKFIQGDYANTGLPDGSFDIVWGQESIVHCEHKDKFVKEAFRLLKPGGRLVIAEYLLRDKPVLSTEEHERMRPFLEGWMMPDLLTPSQYKGLFAAAGFKSVALHDLSANVEPSLKKCQHNAGLALPFIGILKRLRLIDTIRHDYTIANYQLYDTFKDGLWRYQVVVGVKS